MDSRGVTGVTTIPTLTTMVGKSRTSTANSLLPRTKIQWRQTASRRDQATTPKLTPLKADSPLLDLIRTEESGPPWLPVRRLQAPALAVLRVVHAVRSKNVSIASSSRGRYRVHATTNLQQSADGVCLPFD